MAADYDRVEGPPPLPSPARRVAVDAAAYFGRAIRLGPGDEVAYVNATQGPLVLRATSAPVGAGAEGEGEGEGEGKGTNP